MDFQLVTSYTPKGDQPRAIGQLMDGLGAGEKHQVLLGVTGSGKTFTMAKIIEQSNRPALILAHNKTLAAQLYHEFKQFFPVNAVEYFVSYYDYYQPEAYIPAGDLYIEKEATINEELDKLRLSATRSLFERRDAIIVSSVSCIYGLGSPEAYYGMLLLLEKGQHISRKDITRRLVEILYERNDTDFRRGTFRVRGDVIEVFPTYDENAYRIEIFGDEIESLSQIDPLFGTVKQKYSRLPIYPKSHYVVQPERKSEAIDSIVAELNEWVAHLESEGRMVEAQRVHQRTRFDLEMIKSMGYCHGIENYSRHFSGRLPGEPPPTLLDYFPRDFLLFVDESHATIPQVHGMWHGDRSRKQTSSTTDSACPRRWTIAPSSSTSSKTASTRRSTSPPRPAPTSSRDRPASSSSRSSAPPASSIPKSRFAPSKARSTICSPRFATAPSAMSASW